MKRLLAVLSASLVLLAGCRGVPTAGLAPAADLVSSPAPVPSATPADAPTPSLPTLGSSPTPADALTLPAPTPSSSPTPVPTSTPVPSPTPSPVAGADGLGDPYYPQMGNGGYDALHYTIDLDVDMAGGTIAGTSTMAARATLFLRSFNLDFHGLQVSQILVDDAEAAFSRQGDELTVTPAAALLAGSTFSVTVAYGGAPEPIQDPGMPFTLIGWQHLEQGVFFISEPSGAKTWYPVNNHPSDKATYTFRITVAEPYIAAANGLLQEVVDHGPSRTYVWTSDDPVASYLTAVYIGELERVTEEGPDGLLIRNYFPVDAGAEVGGAFRRTAEMIALFSDLFGPYPFEAYGVVVADTPFSGAMENQTLSLFDTDALVEEIAAHELAHQWFGDSVTPATWQDIWLNEGFATYASALWVEHLQGRAALEGLMAAMYEDVQAMGPPGDPAVDGLFGGSVYRRGAWTLHALRLEVGDQAFFDILRSYYDRHKYGNASTGDFVAVAEEVSGQDLAALFEAWLYAAETPRKPDG